MDLKHEQICVARVLHEDGDFITLEVGKRDDVTFNLAQGLDPDATPDLFFTIVFLNAGEGRFWLPWTEA